MAQYKITVQWERGEQRFTDNTYNRRHTWTFDGGITVVASSSPHVVPVPYSDTAAVDPEEAFVASLSSCHMLWFLSIAANRGYCVDSYIDDAVGTLAKNASRRLAMTRVILRPLASFSGHRVPSRNQIKSLHDEAHRQCYIANSVKTEVCCEPVYA
jgi:organic hydroperoxide reductase OsmC/OhrA